MEHNWLGGGKRLEGGRRLLRAEGQRIAGWSNFLNLCVSQSCGDILLCVDLNVTVRNLVKFRRTESRSTFVLVEGVQTTVKNTLKS